MDSTEVMDAQTFLVKTTEPQDVTTKKDITVEMGPVERKRRQGWEKDRRW